MAREAILKGARQKKVSHTIAGRINEFVPKSKNKGGKRDLRYDLPRELRSSFNTIVKSISPQEAISNVSTQEFNEIAYWLSEKPSRIIIALNLLLPKILKSS